jgi:hypothetical protein
MKRRKRKRESICRIETTSTSSIKTPECKPEPETGMWTGLSKLFQNFSKLFKTFQTGKIDWIEIVKKQNTKLLRVVCCSWSDSVLLEIINFFEGKSELQDLCFFNILLNDSRFFSDTFDQCGQKKPQRKTGSKLVKWLFQQPLVKKLWRNISAKKWERKGKKMWKWLFFIECDRVLLSKGKNKTNS